MESGGSTLKETTVDNILSLLTYFCMLSVAAERAVELLKNAKLKQMNVPIVTYQILAGLVGSLIAFFSPPPLTTITQMDPWVAIAATGLAVSGGSAFWNTMLDSFTAFAKSLKAVPVTLPTSANTTDSTAKTGS